MDISKLNVWDSSSHLKTDQDITLYLETCIEEAGDDSVFMTKAFDKAEHARKTNAQAKA